MVIFNSYVKLPEGISWISHGYGTSTPTSFALAHQGRNQDRADHEGIQQDTGDDPGDSGQ